MGFRGFRDLGCYGFRALAGSCGFEFRAWGFKVSGLGWFSPFEGNLFSTLSVIQEHLVVQVSRNYLALIVLHDSVGSNGSISGPQPKDCVLKLGMP